jgi:TolB protein
MNANGTNQVRLSTTTSADIEAAFSTDGSRIGFASDRDGSIEVYIMNADGTGQMRLTPSRRIQ